MFRWALHRRVLKDFNPCKYEDPGTQFRVEKCRLKKATLNRKKQSGAKVKAEVEFMMKEELLREARHQVAEAVGKNPNATTQSKVQTEICPRVVASEVLGSLISDAVKSGALDCEGIDEELMLAALGPVVAAGATQHQRRLDAKEARQKAAANGTWEPSCRQKEMARQRLLESLVCPEFLPAGKGVKSVLPSFWPSCTVT